MKLNKKHNALSFLRLFTLIALSTYMLSNFWELIIENTDSKHNQNTFFAFKSSEMNTNNGEYLLYKQEHHYKTLEKAKSISKFDTINYEARWNNEISCGDILSTYAKKTNVLEFIKCEKPKNSQVIVKATYRVNGEQAKMVEEFLVKNYGMGKLKWTCCGWDVAGNHGRFDHSEFKKIDMYCSAIISMYASGEVKDKNEPTGIKLETNRNKIDYFTITVELIIV